MQKIFQEVSNLDKRCYEEFGLSEDILMEHAANGMASYIKENFPSSSTITIICGSGNNGADGIVLSRLLSFDYDVKILLAKETKSKMALLQLKRARSIGVNECTQLGECDVLVDALVGTGFKGEFDENLSRLMLNANQAKAFKIACDIPSGLRSDGTCAKNIFKADISLTMGALKKSLFLDEAKEYVGEIKVLDLGVSRSVYETTTPWHLLEEQDLKLPFRTKKDSHKGTYGHLSVAYGEKSGASIISGLSALKFGSGLVTLIHEQNSIPVELPYSLMSSSSLPKNTTALALGMGLGNAFLKKDLALFLDNSLPIICDADIFYMDEIKKILQRQDVVITPHPKEFTFLLKLLAVCDISVEELQENRFHYAELFCNLYPNVTLLLKGANVIIAHNGEFYINSNGTGALAKGGSGDVLSGLIGGLLAQGYSTLDASIHASLTHTLLAKMHKGNDFSLTPQDMITTIEML